MILVVCPNLAVDVTLEIDALTVGEVHRVSRSHRRAGGKGVNLARAAANLGQRAVIVGFVGGRRGGEIRSLLDEEGLESQLVELGGNSRMCTILLEPSGTATVINEAGPSLPLYEAEEKSEVLMETIRGRLDDASAVALMGSLQPGLRETLFEEIATRAMEARRYCLVDTSGGALRAALAASPDVVKPNLAEAEALFERTFDDERACAEALTALRRSGARLAVVTRGADGVVFSSGDTVARCLSSPASDMRYSNPTGAGDALAAGLLVGHLRGFDAEESVRLGVAAASASLAEGYGRFRAKDLRPEAVHVRSLAQTLD